MKKATVALVKGNDRYLNVRNALSLIKKDVKIPKKPILIKPNFVSTTEILAATHRDAVRAVLDFLIELGIDRFVIGEGPASAPAEEGYRNFGYYELERDYNIEFIDLNRDDWVQVNVFDRDFKLMKVRVSKTALKSYRISVTRPKTHDTVIVTLSLKNMVVGSLIKEDKSLLHQGYQAINLSLAALARIIPPNLSIIDGFIAMEGNGPIYGTAIAPRIAIASTDFLATDTVTSHVIGFNPSQIGYLYYCKELGLGCGDLTEIEILGNTIEECLMPFTPHYTYQRQLNWKVENWKEIFAKL
jgi:uncharacterized protein (DUF362 family)